MANLNLGQDVANKRERKLTTAHIVAKSYPLRYVSLININPSRLYELLTLCLFTWRKGENS